MKFEILDELNAILHECNGNANLQLEEDILQNGLISPLLVGIIHQKAYLIDGHRRWEIIQKHDLDYQTVTRSFESIEQAKNYILRFQQQRRERNTFGQVYSLFHTHYNDVPPAKMRVFISEQTGFDANTVLTCLKIIRSEDQRTIALALNHGASPRQIRKRLDNKECRECFGKSAYDGLPKLLKLNGEVLYGIGQIAYSISEMQQKEAITHYLEKSEVDIDETMLSRSRYRGRFNEYTKNHKPKFVKWLKNPDRHNEFGNVSRLMEINTVTNYAAGWIQAGGSTEQLLADVLFSTYNQAFKEYILEQANQLNQTMEQYSHAPSKELLWT